jgi:hypothetical protein
MCPTTTLASLINCLVDYFFIGGLFPLMMGIALVVFLWGVYRFIRNSGDETARTEGKKLIFWGLIGLFVMLCVWAFVEILARTFFSRAVSIPQVRI